MRGLTRVTHLQILTLFVDMVLWSEGPMLMFLQVLGRKEAFLLPSTTRQTQRNLTFPRFP